MVCCARALGVVAFALAVVAPAAPGNAQPVVTSPPSPSSRVLWDHDGEHVDWFEVRVDGLLAVRVPAGPSTKAGTFQAPTPFMTPGQRTLTVAACNEHGCVSSAPLVVTVVVGPIRWEPDHDPVGTPFD